MSSETVTPVMIACLKRQIDALSGELEAEKARNKELEQKNSCLEHVVAMLQNHVRGRDKWEEIVKNRGWDQEKDSKKRGEEIKEEQDSEGESEEDGERNEEVDMVVDMMDDGVWEGIEKLRGGE
jgi:hypothetical protein